MPGYRPAPRVAKVVLGKGQGERLRPIKSFKQHHTRKEQSQPDRRPAQEQSGLLKCTHAPGATRATAGAAGSCAPSIPVQLRAHRSPRLSPQRLLLKAINDRCISETSTSGAGGVAACAKLPPGTPASLLRTWIQVPAGLLPTQPAFNPSGKPAGNQFGGSHHSCGKLSPTPPALTRQGPSPSCHWRSVNQWMEDPCLSFSLLKQEK